MNTETPIDTSSFQTDTTIDNMDGLTSILREKLTKMASQDLHNDVQIKKESIFLLKCSLLLKDVCILFAITAAGVVSCGGLKTKKSPRTSSLWLLQ